MQSLQTLNDCPRIVENINDFDHFVAGRILNLDWTDTEI